MNPQVQGSGPASPQAGSFNTMLIAAQFPELSALRTQLRRLRNQLGQAQYLSNSAVICQYAEQLLLEHSNKQFGAYNAFDGEPDLSALLATRENHSWFPVVDKQSNQMTFAQGSEQQQNQFGISEPTPTALVSVTELSVIFVPLVGYDNRGNRIGMGKGFYDRALANTSKETLLVGIAHSCQQVDLINPQPWDVALDCVITESGIVHASDN